MRRTIAMFLLTMSVLSLPYSVSAQSDIGFKGVGGRLSYFSLGDASATGSLYDLNSALGITATADLGMITPQIGLEGYLTYWSTSDDVSVTGPSTVYPYVTQQYTSEWSIRDIIVGGRGRYHFQTSNDRLTPFAGAGLGLHFVNVALKTNTPGAPPISGSETHFGLDLGGGVSYELSPTLDLSGELWYAMTDVDQLSVSAGIVYWLGGSGK